MEHIVNIGAAEIRFISSEGLNCWQTKTMLGGLDIEIEINFDFHKEKEIDWNHFAGFYKFINEGNRFKDIVSASKNLAHEVGRAFFRDCYHEVADYQMEFSNSIFYNGKTDGNFIRDGYSFSLIFNYWTKRGDRIHGDEYGLYLVDVENFIIVGAKRHQC